MGVLLVEGGWVGVLLVESEAPDYGDLCVAWHLVVFRTLLLKQLSRLCEPHPKHILFFFFHKIAFISLEQIGY